MANNFVSVSAYHHEAIRILAITDDCVRLYDIVAQLKEYGLYDVYKAKEVSGGYTLSRYVVAYGSKQEVREAIQNVFGIDIERQQSNNSGFSKVIIHLFNEQGDELK